MHKKLCITSLLVFFFAQGFSQSINLIFPKLSGSEAWIYTFTGSKVDSVNVVLDKNGKASYTLPQKNYRGIVYLYIPQKGGSEFIVAEPQLTVTAGEERFTPKSLIFPHSVENEYFRYIFERRNYLSSRQEWLIAGSVFVEKNTPFFDNLQDLKTENELALAQLSDSVRNSKLYAARYSELVLLMQKLYENIQNPEMEQLQDLKNEMEQMLSIETLYHAGNLWTNILNYYPGLFMVNFDNEMAQETYAQSIITTAKRLQEPVLTDFILSSITACERSNLQTAIDKLVEYMVGNHPQSITVSPMLQRMIQSNTIKQGTKAPEITGLKTPLAQPVLVIFYESDCSHCTHELKELSARSALIQSKGYRIISISSDVNKMLYNTISQLFTWSKDDQLCDWNGFAGENFKRFAVSATPTIFLISADGKIIGKYAQIAEVMEEIR